MHNNYLIARRQLANRESGIAIDSSDSIFASSRLLICPCETERERDEIFLLAEVRAAVAPKSSGELQGDNINDDDDDEQMTRLRYQTFPLTLFGLCRRMHFTKRQEGKR